MAKYMITWRLPAETRNVALKRFMEGSAMQPPEGVTHISRWHGVSGLGWGVVETDDPKNIADWLLRWTDLISYDVFPVITDEEIGALLQKHGLG